MHNIISPAAFNYTMSVLEELEGRSDVFPELTESLKTAVIEVLEAGVNNGYDTYLDKFN